MRWARFLAVAAGAGCGGPADPCAPCAGRRCEPTLEIGLGLERFEPLPEGGEFPLIHGPQGGYHLEIGLRATHLDGSSLVTARLEGTVDGVSLAVAHPWLELACEPMGLESWGTLLIYASTPDHLDGRETRVAAEVTDVASTRVSAVGTYVIRDSP